MERPVIGITMGDPAGIGPELIVKVLANDSVYGKCRPIVVGDAGILRDACALVRVPLKVRAVETLGNATFTPGTVDVVAPRDVTLAKVVPGTVNADTGRAAAACLALAHELGMAGTVDGVVSAPMNKQAFHLAGFDYVDEVDYIAALTKSPDPFLLGVVNPSLWTIPVTLHVPFRKIAELVTRERVRKHVQRIYHVLRALGFAEPSIAVAALNVHGGEGGRFGREEIDEIAPAIKDARADGINATGPYPADTIFVRARAGEFNGVVCMYHDQANIARKLLASSNGATMLMGMPVVWGTTAHGTALDKAGKGIGDPRGLDSVLAYTTALAARGIR